MIGGLLICLFQLASFAMIGEYQFVQERSLPTCDKSKAEKLVGGRFKLSVPRGAVTKNLDDHDYQNYFIGFGKGKGRVWMSGGFGPNWSSGNPPQGWLESLTVAEKRNWTTEKRNDRGVDITGRTADGKFSRYFGGFGETITYEGASSAAAEYFDSMVDNICYQEP